MYYIYIIRTERNTLYTGITSDVKRRMREHLGLNGKGAKYTRSNKPVSIEALWSCDKKGDALRLEAKIKKLTRSEKLDVIANMTHPFPESEEYIRENVDGI